ncbi:MAG: OmpH family outer membrane protein [Henriciella sp.]|nr:OmpH family outer membrane protein [Henriciella sp.]
MSLVKRILAAIALSFSPIIVAAPIAAAQGTNVVVIDQSKIMRDSAAGKDIRTKLQGIGQSIERELQPTATSLQNEGQALDAKAQGKTQQAILADQALTAEITAYARKAQQFEQRSQIAAQELALTERKAWSDFFVALRPVLREVVEERGAQLMVDRSNSVYTDPAIDVSDLVISKLDAATPTISVVRQKIPTQPAQAAAAQ